MRKQISIISTIHYFRLFYRGALFLSVAVLMIISDNMRNLTFQTGIEKFPVLFAVIWCVFTFEMISRFFPSKTESMGCQKQFKRNFIPTKTLTTLRKTVNRGVAIAAISWLTLNGLIWFLYIKGVLTQAWMLLISLFYSVSDMICILFYCPFQTLMMKNRCCTTCRIYNWDYLMMCTPLLFIKSWFTTSLSILAAILFVRWEITAFLTPERFDEACNDSLRCANCQERLCHHKKQLRKFWASEKRKANDLLKRTL